MFFELGVDLFLDLGFKLMSTSAPRTWKLIERPKYLKSRSLAIVCSVDEKACLFEQVGVDVSFYRFARCNKRAIKMNHQTQLSILDKPTV